MILGTSAGAYVLLVAVWWNTTAFTTGAYWGRHVISRSSAPHAARVKIAGRGTRAADSVFGGTLATGFASDGASVGSISSAVMSCGARPLIQVTDSSTPSLGPSHTSSAPPRVFDFLAAGWSLPSSAGPTACQVPQSWPGTCPRTATLMSPTPSGSRQVTPTALNLAVDARTIVSVRGFAPFGIDFSASGTPAGAPFAAVTPAAGVSKLPSESSVTCGVMPAPPGALAAGLDQRIGAVCTRTSDGPATAPPATSNGTAIVAPMRSFLSRRRYLLSIASNTMGDAMGGFAGQIG